LYFSEGDIGGTTAKISQVLDAIKLIRNVFGLQQELGALHRKVRQLRKIKEQLMVATVLGALLLSMLVKLPVLLGFQLAVR